MMIESLHIANRGEIARRIIRTARRLGVRTIAAHSDVDANKPVVTQADGDVSNGEECTASAGAARGDTQVVACQAVDRRQMIGIKAVLGAEDENQGEQCDPVVGQVHESGLGRG